MFALQMCFQKRFKYIASYCRQTFRLLSFVINAKSDEISQGMVASLGEMEAVEEFVG